MAKKRTPKQILDSVASGRKSLTNPNIVLKKNRRDLTKGPGPDPLMEKEVYQTIDWMREGKSHQWCTDQLKATVNERTGRVYAPRFVENIVTAANQLINIWYRSQIHKVEQVHVARYNKIIVDLLNKKYEFNEMMPEWLCVKIQANDLEDVLQAMKQKETLLGMHRKSFKLTFNTQNNININTQPPKEQVKKLDITKLSLEEQIELMELIELSSKGEDELFGVRLRDKSDDKESIDIEAEVINDNIKHIEPFTKPNQDNNGSTLLDIKNIIQQRLLNAAKK